MDRNNFFKQIVDNYLFLDLRNISELEQKEGEEDDAAGYPMLTTCVSGMELLGGLLYGRNYNSSRNWNYFEHYRDNYLVKTRAESKVSMEHGEMPEETKAINYH